MSFAPDMFEMLMPTFRRYGVRLVVKNIYVVRNHHTITNVNGLCRPDPATFANKAPFANSNVSAVSKNQQLPINH